MAGDARIRHCSFYFEQKKVAMGKTIDYDLNSNDQEQIADEGVVGYADGAITSKVSLDTIVPVKGVGVSILEAMLSKKYVDVGLGVVDGKLHKIKMRILTAKYTSDAEKGTLVGKFEFGGGTPERVG